MKTTLSLLVLFFVVLGGGYLLSTRSQPNTPVAVVTPAQKSATTTQGTTPAPVTPPKTSTGSGQGSTGTGTGSGSTGGTTAGTYTSAQVATHNTSGSCWTSINGSVYNLTTWISQHPGGQGAILSICGKDGTQAFEAQHGGGRDTRPQTILATFKIGTLAS